jgi:hypothetical protein
MKSVIGLTVVVAAVALTTGCASDNAGATSYSAISGNLTPELMTPAERPIDVDAHIALTRDVNGRLFWQDLGRMFYTDRESWLSPWPTASVTGTPR